MTKNDAAFVAAVTRWRNKSTVHEAADKLRRDYGDVLLGEYISFELVIEWMKQYEH